MSKINTSKTMANVELSQADLERQIKDAAIILREEKKVKVSIPKALQKSIGLTLPLGINGAMIVLPVDGTEHEVPAPYKALLNDYLANLTT